MTSPPGSPRPTPPAGSRAGSGAATPSSRRRALGGDAFGAALASLHPSSFCDKFPSPEAIQDALDHFEADPHGARACDPVSVPEFFGSGDIHSANIHSLRVELIRPRNVGTGKPIAFLSAYFHGSDLYWNDRFKDVALYNLFDALGIRNVIPEARYLQHEGRALVRIWTDYTPLGKAAPADLRGEALLQELARIAIVSYVAGNVDGPGHNHNNGGFSRFRGPDGRDRWGGVLIDQGASFNELHEHHKPWNAKMGPNHGVPLCREHIPKDVVAGLQRMAGSTRSDLARMSRFAHVDDGAKRVVEQQRARAREILDYYSFDYTCA